MSAIAETSSESTRAPVAPRGWVVRTTVASSLPSTESLPLEVLVRRELQTSKQPMAVAICAQPGFGKSTALRHLATVLTDFPHVTMLDEPDLSCIGPMSQQAKLVFTTELRVKLVVPYTTVVLAPWREDDAIEYLLARHRSRVSSVMSRVRCDPMRDELAGCPLLWTIVLDAMAADDSIADCGAALCAHLDQLLDSDAALDAAGRAALAILCRTDVVDTRDPTLSRAAHLLHHPFVRMLLAAERITWQLGRADNCEALGLALPIELIAMIAQRVANRPAMLQQLQSIMLSDRDAQHAMAASILLRARPEWRGAGTAPCLANAFLRGAKWTGLNLERADLANADLSDSELANANLHESLIARANFNGAQLRGAFMIDAHGPSASFASADLRNARIDGADLSSANFNRADLSFASLRRAALDDGSFRSAILRRANCESTQLTRAILDDADCYQTDFSLAVLDHVDLSRPRDCRGAIFRRASLKHACLAGLQLRDADFVKADLDDADLTESSIANGNFRDAILTNAGLADIDWPDADLRGVDFTGASFHLGSTRSGLVGSAIPCEGSRTGFYTDEFNERDFKSPEEIRKANLCGADLRGALVEGTDWYLVDLRGAKYGNSQADHFRRCGAILC